jgi:hypothetical protein
MPILQLTSSPIKTTSLTQKILIKDILAGFQQLFLPKSSIRIHKELEKVKEVNERLVSENKVLRIEISNIKTVDKQLAKRDG